MIHLNVYALWPHLYKYSVNEECDGSISLVTWRSQGLALFTCPVPGIDLWSVPMTIEACLQATVGKSPGAPMRLPPTRLLHPPSVWHAYARPRGHPRSALRLVVRRLTAYSPLGLHCHISLINHIHVRGHILISIYTLSYAPDPGRYWPVLCGQWSA